MGDLPVVVELDMVAAQNDDDDDGGGGDNDDDGGYWLHYFLLGRHPSDETKQHEITYKLYWSSRILKFANINSYDIACVCSCALIG